jgi:CcmD family protein
MSRKVFRRLVLRVVLALAVVSGSAAPAVAAQPPPAPQDEYLPLSEIPPEEQLPAQPLVFGAYAFIWVAVLVYVLLLWRRLGAVQQDLDALKRAPRG